MSCRPRTLACRLLKPDDDEGTDYRLPLSGVVKASLEELKHQQQPFSAVKPKISGFRENDYTVCQGFSFASAKLDDDCNLLAKTQSKLVVSSKYRCVRGNMVKVRFEFSIIIKFCTFIWPLSENRLSYIGEICSVQLHNQTLRFELICM